MMEKTFNSFEVSMTCKVTLLINAGYWFCC